MSLFQFKKFRVHIKIGCYRLGALNEKELAHMMNETTAMTSYLSNMDNTMIERSGDLFQADIEILPELMQYVEFTEITDDDVTGDVNEAGDFVEQMEIEDFENWWAASSQTEFEFRGLTTGRSC